MKLIPGAVQKNIMKGFGVVIKEYKGVDLQQKFTAIFGASRTDISDCALWTCFIHEICLFN